jgi:protein ImuA
MSPLPNRLAEPLERLLRDSPHLWRGESIARVDVRATGYADLDARLPGGGWPIGALVEIAPACDGLGELSLTLPALRSWCREGRSVAFVHPPYTPYAPALVRYGLPLDSVLWIAADCDEDARWAAEQLLREGAAAVLLWSSIKEDRALRRLQLAAEAGGACAFLYRSPSMLSNASPAALRIALSAAGEEVRADIVKVRGGHPQALTLPLRPLAQ